MAKGWSYQKEIKTCFVITFLLKSFVSTFHFIFMKLINKKDKILWTTSEYFQIMKSKRQQKGMQVR